MDEREPEKQLSRKQRKKLEARQRAEVTAPPDTILQSRLVRFGKRLLDLALLVIGVVGGIAGLWSFFPAFSVSSNPPLNPLDPVTSFFIIRYDSPIPIKTVDPVCDVNELKEVGRGEVGMSDFPMESFQVPEMWQGDKIAVPCVVGRAIALQPITSADITIAVQFRPFLIPQFLHLHPWERDFRFVTVRYSNGAFGWVPEPPNYPSHPKAAN